MEQQQEQEQEQDRRTLLGGVVLAVACVLGLVLSFFGIRATQDGDGSTSSTPKTSAVWVVALVVGGNLAFLYLIYRVAKWRNGLRRVHPYASPVKHLP
jgi:hypothetical protein